MAITEEQLDAWFTHHPPRDAEEEGRHMAIRAAARRFADAILLNTPVCADQSAAIRHVREASMTASAAVACKGV